MRFSRFHAGRKRHFVFLDFEFYWGKDANHGVSFEEAKSVFFDDFALQFFDQANSEVEDRFLMLGMSNETKLLIVCHCERDDGNIIRIISARKATKNESKHYLKGD
jgi:uncharacterized DUF497 family protein